MYKLLVLFFLSALPSMSFSSDSACCLPIVTGPCRGSFPRYGYNTTSGHCQQFIYGGCKGNENSYDTLEDCQDACDSRDPACCLPIVTGPCRARIPRYGYNTTSGHCQQFIYGGCKGNENSYDTLEDCQDACDRRDPACCLPLKMGPCTQYVIRYGYNTNTGYCEPFIYGGCQGNANRYSTLQSCEAACYW